MKPLKIKISAFGPYKNCIDIDFEKLGESGIFLITGDTGAGKTTIFDSISFALFGEVSGSNRPVPSVRSDFADNDTETFVELEFTHKNKKYFFFCFRCLVVGLFLGVGFCFFIKYIYKL